MKEFFRGWKRKVGVFTLLMACALMCGWFRSWKWWETLLVLDTGVRNCTINSNQGQIAWIDWHEHSENPTKLRYFQMDACEFSEYRPIENLSRFVIFTKAVVRFPPGRSATADVRIIDYWSVVTPLTLLSAYLLLVKPRVAKPQKSVEPDRT